MQEKFARLDQVSERGRLKINILKTKEMHINPKSFTLLRVQGQNIENVESFTFLGSIINKEG
jgi:hypothetical protein